MMPLTVYFLSLLLLGMTAGTAVRAAPTAKRYAVTDLATLSGGNRNEAVGINNRGEVVGWSEVGGDSVDLYTTITGVIKGPARHAFRWKNGQTHDLGVLPGYDSSEATAINNNGSIIGRVFNIYSRAQADFSHGQLKPSRAVLFEKGKISLIGPGGGAEGIGLNDHGTALLNFSNHSLVYARGKLTDIGTFPSRPDAYSAFQNSSVGHGINNRGQVVGTGSIATATDLLFHAFRWHEGQMEDLGARTGLRQTEALATNESGTVVGLANGLHACVWEKGTYRQLSDGWTRAWGINRAGQVVGLSHEDESKYRDEGSGHAVLWEGDSEYALNDLIPSGSGWVLSEAHGINDRGQIVGFGKYNGQHHAFLLTPQR